MSNISPPSTFSGMPRAATAPTAVPSDTGTMGWADMLAQAAGLAPAVAGQTVMPGEATGPGHGAALIAPGTPGLSDANWAMHAAAPDELASGAAASTAAPLTGGIGVGGSPIELAGPPTDTRAADPSAPPSPTVSDTVAQAEATARTADVYKAASVQPQAEAEAASAAATQIVSGDEAAATDDDEASIEAAPGLGEVTDGVGDVVLPPAVQAAPAAQAGAARLASDPMSVALGGIAPSSSTGPSSAAAIAPDISATQAAPDAGAHPVLDTASASSFEAALSTSPALDPGSRSDALVRGDPFLAERSGLTTAGVATGQAANPAAPGVPIAQVPVEIGLRSLSGANRFDIRLSPDDLGRVDVRLDIALDGTVKAQLVVERPETLAFLQRDAGHLERALEQAGLKPGEGGVAITLRDPAGEGAGHRREQQDPAERGRAQAAAREARDQADRDAQTTPLRSYGWTRASGVDVRI